MTVSIYQHPFINAFMRKIDALLAEMDLKDLSAIDTLLNSSSQGLSMVEAAIQYTSSALAILGVATAPVGGIGLGILAGTGTGIAAAKTSYQAYKFIKRSFEKNQSTAVSLKGLNTEEKQFFAKIFLRHVAYAVLIRYGYFINEIVVESSLSDLADFAAVRSVKKMIKYQIDEKFTIADFLDYLSKSTPRANVRLEVNETYRFANVFGAYFSAKVYARSRVACYSLSSTGQLQWSYYASSKESNVKLGVGDETTLSKYGYKVMSSVEALSYIAKKNLKEIKLSIEDEKEIKSHLSISYAVTRQDVQHYLNSLSQDQSIQQTLNDFLSERFEVTIIAHCNNENLKGLPLSRGNFSQCNFSKADLRDCILNDTLWNQACLDEAKFGNTDESTVYLNGCSFNEASLEQSNWNNVNFSGTRFFRTSLKGAVFNRSLFGTMQHIDCSWDWVVLKEMDMPDQNFLDQLEKRVEKLEIKMAELSQEIETLKQPASQKAARMAVIISDKNLENLPEILHPLYADYKIIFNNQQLQTMLNYYVEPDVLYPKSAHYKRQPLSLQWPEFLSGTDDKLMLLHGDVGAGKSLAARLLQKKLWETWSTESDFIPILIELKQVQDGKANFLLEYLKNFPFNYTEEEILLLKQQFSFVLILDGWDECGSVLTSHNIFQLCALAEWRVKIVLSARTEWLQKQPNYGRLLTNNLTNIDPLECIIAPFTTKQVDHYLQKRYKDSWEYYRDLLYKHIDIQKMINSPVMLHIICDGEIIAMLTEPSNVIYNRSWLYKTFLHGWFKREILKPYNLDTESDIDVNALLDRLLYYTQELAFMMFVKNQLSIERTYQNDLTESYERTRQSLHLQVDPWAWFFDNTDNRDVRRAQRSCPLLLEQFDKKDSSGQVQRIHRYQFIHKSFMEFAVAEKLWLALQSYESKTIEIWNQRFITDELGILTFLKERIQTSDNVELCIRNLKKLVLESKNHPEFAKASSSAITCLNRLGFSFSAKMRDLSNVNIPNADLTNGLLAFVNFKNSDLRYTYFHDATLIGACLNNTQLAGAHFSTVLSVSTATDKVLSLTIHAEHTDLIAYTEGSDIVVAQLSDGKIYRRYTEHTDNVSSLSWSPSGKLLASGSFDGTIRLWNLATQEETSTYVTVLKGHQNSIYSVAWSPDGKKIASCGGDNTIRIWTITNTEITNEVVSIHSNAIYQVAWSYDGRKLASASADKTVCVWDVLQNIQLHKFHGHQDDVTTVSWFPDGRLISGGLDKRIFVWNTTNLAQERNYLASFTAMTEITYIACSSSNGLLAVGCHNGDIIILDTTRSEADAHLTLFDNHRERINQIVWSADQIITCGNDKSIQVLDVMRSIKEKKESYLQRINAVACVAWSSDGSMLAMGYNNGLIRIKDFSVSSSAGQDKVLDLHTQKILDLVWAPNSNEKLASASEDKTIIIWDVAQQTCLSKIAGHRHWIFKVTWSPNAQLLASASLDSTACVWDVSNSIPNKLATLKGHVITTCAAFSPDSKCLATAGRDSSILLWNVEDFQKPFILAQLKGHGHWVNSIAWSPNGQYLATAGVGTTVRVWDAATKRCLKILRGHVGNKQLNWKPCGQYLISSCSQNIFLWNVQNNYQPVIYNFGASSLSCSNSKLAIAYQQAVYMIDIHELPDFALTNVINQANLWVQGCEINNVLEMSLHMQQYLQQRGAISKNTLKVSTHMTNEQVALIASRLHHHKNKNHPDIAVALFEFANALVRENCIETAITRYQQARLIYQNCSLELYATQIKNLDEIILRLQSQALHGNYRGRMFSTDMANISITKGKLITKLFHGFK